MIPYYFHMHEDIRDTLIYCLELVNIGLAVCYWPISKKIGHSPMAVPFQKTNLVTCERTRVSAIDQIVF